MPTTTLTVSGMTCDHCVHAVTAGLEKLAGVDCVEVNRASGAVTLTSRRPLADHELRAAVAEAGYETVS